MADVNSGIEAGEEKELSIDSDAGFNAALARKVAGGGELSDEAKAAIANLEESDTSVEGGLTYEESRPRDDHGRFARKEEPVAESAEEEGAAPADEEREEEKPETDWKTQFENLE